jgi:protein phosphatase 4 regulatory subunit 3
VVLAEDTHKTLLAHRICTDDDIYHRQGGQRPLISVLARGGLHPNSPLTLADDTIITWTDSDVGTDVALSFQEANGCHAIWCGGAARAGPRSVPSRPADGRAAVLWRAL